MTTRIRHVEFDDPHALADAGRSLSGLEFLRKLVARELPQPPLAKVLNFELAEISTATAEGKVFNARGQLCAHGTTTCLLLRG